MPRELNNGVVFHFFGVLKGDAMAYWHPPEYATGKREKWPLKQLGMRTGIQVNEVHAAS